MGSFLFSFRMADFIQFFPAVAAIVKGKDKFKVLVVRRFQTYEQLVETVDVLFPTLDFLLHMECADIITGAFNSQYMAEFVIHFEIHHLYVV